MSVKLSIVVPVYNVQEFVKECISSLLEIPIDEKEIIVINDGSTDKSVEIVKSLNSNKIKIINQKNGGLSSARNTGLIEAKGDYILFIDSDDYIINPENIKEMLYTAVKNDLDIVSGNGYTYYTEENKFKIHSNLNNLNKVVLDGNNYLKECLKNNDFSAVVWLNIYKADFIKQNNFVFKEGIYHEDIEWTIKVLLKANKVMYTDELFYIYRQREGSIMRSKDYTKHAIDMINTCVNNMNIVEEVEDNNLIKLVQDEMLNTIFWAVMRAKKTNKKFFKESILKDIPYNKCNSKKVKFKYLIFKLNKNLAYYMNELYENKKKSII